MGSGHQSTPEESQQASWTRERHVIDLPEPPLLSGFQEEHHRVKSFREELIELLARAGVEYDAKYLD
jgi:hypothetical protein